MTFSNDTIKKTIHGGGLIPIFYHPDIEIAKAVLDASYRGGVRVFEFTNRGANAFQVFSQLKKHVQQYPDLILGIGTVINGETTRKYIEAGADFIVSPILKPEMAAVCKQYDKIWMPGCGTLTEIVNAKELGAEIIKIFPGFILGPTFVSAVLPLVADLQLMPTGGVEPTEESLSAWFKAGVYCVGMGSQLITKEIIANKNWNLLQKNMSHALAIIRRIKSSQV